MNRWRSIIWSSAVLVGLAGGCSKAKAPSAGSGDASWQDAVAGEETLAPERDAVLAGPDAGTPPGPVTISSTKGMTVTTKGSHLFSLDTQTQEFELPVRGSRTLKLAGVLASPDGQRRVVLRDGGKETEVFAPGWLLPGVGALSDNGDLAVCVNSLTGPASVLTKGTMPDPSAGTDLLCRLRKNDAWQDSVVLEAPKGAFWLRDVVARPSGAFWVLYMKDRSGKLVTLPEPGDGLSRVSFDASGFGIPSLVHSLVPK